MAAKKKIRVIRRIALWDTGELPGYDMGYGQPPYIDAFLLNAKEPVGAVLICPGGGYEHLAEHEGAPVAQWLNACGYAAFVLHYRVAPYRYPYPLVDARRALCHIRFNSETYGLRADKIGVLGFSAGGHLAGSLATQRDPSGIPDDIDPVERMSSRPDFLILGYPVVTFSGRYANQASIQNLIGRVPKEEERNALSIEKNIRPETPPTFIWHTAEDETVPVQNSLLLAAALQGTGIPMEMHIFSRGRHGLGLAQGTEAGAWTQLCAAWLDKLV
jgi:acetyl esterase/lipase